METSDVPMKRTPGKRQRAASIPLPLHDYQVLQRGDDGHAHVALESGEIVSLPTGGPYEVGGARFVLVGDLWVLAGQSNMEGVGDLVDTEEPTLGVHSYQSREQWAVAEEPLHWLGESPRLVHHKLWGRDAVPDAPDPRDGERLKGAGLGLTFARTRLERTGVPVGLIPCAHGGTSMTQWNPELRGEGGASLYGATLERVRANGGKVAGVLWYQGESDANPDDMDEYDDKMYALIEAFRTDFGQPRLPFLFVQLGRYVTPTTPESERAWSRVRDNQRYVALYTENAALASAIDLDLDDGIHIGTQSLKRLGRRLADLADGYSGPDLRAVTFGPGNTTLRVFFDGVRGGLRSAGRPSGFLLHDKEWREVPRIFKVTLEGDRAELHLTTPLHKELLFLSYGYGTDPYCNLTDTGDAAMPAFGPFGVQAN